MIRGKCLWGTPLRSEACSSIHMMNVNLGVILKSKKSIFSMFYSDFKFLHPHRGYKRGGGVHFCVLGLLGCVLDSKHTPLSYQFIIFKVSQKFFIIMISTRNLFYTFC